MADGWRIKNPKIDWSSKPSGETSTEDVEVLRDVMGMYPIAGPVPQPTNKTAIPDGKAAAKGMGGFPSNWPTFQAARIDSPMPLPTAPVPTAPMPDESIFTGINKDDPALREAAVQRAAARGHVFTNKDLPALYNRGNAGKLSPVPIASELSDKENIDIIAKNRADKEAVLRDYDITYDPVGNRIYTKKPEETSPVPTLDWIANRFMSAGPAEFNKFMSQLVPLAYKNAEENTPMRKQAKEAERLKAMSGYDLNRAQIKKWEDEASMKAPATVSGYKGQEHATMQYNPQTKQYDVPVMSGSLPKEESAQGMKLAEIYGSYLSKHDTLSGEAPKPFSDWVKDFAGETPPVSKLKNGVHTKFQNGQIWTLQNGQPVRIQ